MLGRCALQSNKTKGGAMAGESQFTIGARASCTDGHCGEVRRLIIDPATETVTHLVIQPGHRQEAGRLVPVHLAVTTNGEIRLRCTLAEFDKLDHAAERDQVTGAAPQQIHQPLGMTVGSTPEGWRQTAVFEDVIPGGEDEVGPGNPVHAVDGEIGRVQGFLVNPDNDRVTHVLLQEGHLWGRKEVAIPISAVIRVDEGIRLNLTMEQVGELPPVA
jgi:sporulation protein YlmC with PRC-barrel domain